MSQVLVLARQAITSWSGFNLRPTFIQVVEAIENLGKGASRNTDVILFFYSSKKLTLFSPKKHVIRTNVSRTGQCKHLTQISNILHALSEHIFKKCICFLDNCLQRHLLILIKT